MESVKVVISNDQKAVKVPTGILLLIRRCCHAVLELHFGEQRRGERAFCG